MFQSAILQPMHWVKELADRGLVAPSGMVTQYVVGAAGEPDSELLTTTAVSVP